MASPAHDIVQHAINELHEVCSKEGKDKHADIDTLLAESFRLDLLLDLQSSLQKYVRKQHKRQIDSSYRK